MVFRKGKLKVEFYYLESTVNEVKRFYFPSAELFIVKNMKNAERYIQ